MMSKEARLGLLVLLGVILFLLALFGLAQRAFLFSDVMYIRARFNQVAGLQPGAPVQFQGVSIGRVEAVNLPPAPGEPIEVIMAIQRKARYLIRKDTRALIKTEGLIGEEIVVLVAGSPDQPPVEEGDYIAGVDPIDLYEVTDRVVSSVARFDSAAVSVSQIVQDIRKGKGTLGKFIYDSTAYVAFVRAMQQADAVMSNLSQEAAALVEIARDASVGVETIIQKINTGEGTVARFLNDPSLYNSLKMSADSLQHVVAAIQVLLDRTEDAINWGNLALFRAAENMEALKHNWLFRGYYEERGYLEKAPFEVRERALEETLKELARQKQELLEWEERLKTWEARLRKLGAAVKADSIQVQENP